MGFEIKKLDLEAWLSAAKKFKDYNYTHYWAYGKKAAERIGAESEHIAIVDKQNNIIGLSNVRIKKLPYNLGGIAYISGGPMVDNGQHDLESNTLSTLIALRNEYVINRGLILRISQRHKSSLITFREASIYYNAGFSICGKTNATIIINLSLQLDTIRKNFHQKWRNSLNKSENQNIEIVAGDDIALFKDFLILYNELIFRKGFDVDMDASFFSDTQIISPPQERFQMAIAYCNKEPIAGHLSSMTGDTAVYLLGASNNLGRKLGAAYLLQWHTINESKKNGMQWYDLGGIDKQGNPNVYLFKERMGGEVTEIGSVFEINVGLKGKLVNLLEIIYKYLKRKN